MNTYDEQAQLEFGSVQGNFILKLQSWQPLRNSILGEGTDNGSKALSEITWSMHFQCSTLT